MAFVHNNTTVGTVRTVVANIPTGNRQNIPVYVQNNDSAAIFLGDADVATSGSNAGWKLAAGANIQFWMNSGDLLYAISAAGTSANVVIVTYSA